MGSWRVRARSTHTGKCMYAHRPGIHSIVYWLHTPIGKRKPMLTPMMTQLSRRYWDENMSSKLLFLYILWKS